MLTPQPIVAVPGDYDRSWSSDDFFDLIIWFEPDGTFHGFQLCYDKARDERALTWTRSGGFRHARVDSGDSEPRANATPVLLDEAEAGFAYSTVRHEFSERSQALAAPVRKLVLEKIEEFARGK